MTNKERAEQTYADNFTAIHGVDYSIGKCAGKWPSQKAAKKSPRGEANIAAIRKAIKDGKLVVKEMHAETGIHKATIHTALKRMVKNGTVEIAGMRKGSREFTASRVYRLVD